MHSLQKRRNLLAKKKESYSVFTNQVPSISNFTDPGTTYELGFKFQLSQPGYITAIRYWKAPSETGTHIGRIWSSTGTLLASVTFSSESGSSWQEQALSVPLLIFANTVYTVSVNVNSYYVATVSGLTNVINNGFLSSVVGNNGSFGVISYYPTSSSNSSNYFRDVVVSSY